MSQGIAGNFAGNAAAPDNSNTLAAPVGEGPDLHYQPVGSRSLEQGDSLAFRVAKADASYERIVEWFVPDTRDATGRPVDDYDRRQHRELYQDAAWDAIRFSNPLPFPMTTGPAMVTEKGRFLGRERASGSTKERPLTFASQKR